MSANSRRKPLLEFRTTAPSPRLALALLRAAALNGQSLHISRWPICKSWRIEPLTNRSPLALHLLRAKHKIKSAHFAGNSPIFSIRR